jgi:hypothetical protein
MSRVLTRVAHAIIRRYPQPWRDRYEGELLAFIEDFPPRLRDVIDLARACIVERARALIEPADRPWVFRALVVTVQVSVRLGALVVALTIGTWLTATLGPPPSPLGYAIVGIWFVVFGTGFWLFMRGLRSQRGAPIWTRPRLPLGWAAVFAAATSLVFWIDLPSGALQWFIWFHISLMWPLGQSGKHTIETLARLGGIREQLSWARKELTRCETLASQGIVTADLDRARAEMARLEREQDEVMQELRGMGYRARFGAAGVRRV